jgi:hypothetical protein
VGIIQTSFIFSRQIPLADNNFSGRNTVTFANGDKYEGDFVNDKWNGKGIITFANAEIRGHPTGFYPSPDYQRIG